MSDPNDPDQAAHLPPDALTPAQLADVAARLARGYYDREAVRDEIVRRLLAREFHRA